MTTERRERRVDDRAIGTPMLADARVGRLVRRVSAHVVACLLVAALVLTSGPAPAALSRHQPRTTHGASHADGKGARGERAEKGKTRGGTRAGKTRDAGPAKQGKQGKKAKKGKQGKKAKGAKQGKKARKGQARGKRDEKKPARRGGARQGKSNTGRHGATESREKRQEQRRAAGRPSAALPDANVIDDDLTAATATDDAERQFDPRPSPESEPAPDRAVAPADATHPPSRAGSRGKRRANQDNAPRISARPSVTEKTTGDEPVVIAEPDAGESPTPTPTLARAAEPRAVRDAAPARATSRARKTRNPQEAHVTSPPALPDAAGETSADPAAPRGDHAIPDPAREAERGRDDAERAAVALPPEGITPEPSPGSTGEAAPDRAPATMPRAEPAPADIQQPPPTATPTPAPRVTPTPYAVPKRVETVSNAASAAPAPLPRPATATPSPAIDAEPAIAAATPPRQPSPPADQPPAREPTPTMAAHGENAGDAPADHRHASVPGSLSAPIAVTPSPSSSPIVARDAMDVPIGAGAPEPETARPEAPPAAQWREPTPAVSAFTPATGAEAPPTETPVAARLTATPEPVVRADGAIVAEDGTPTSAPTFAAGAVTPAALTPLPGPEDGTGRDPLVGAPVALPDPPVVATPAATPAPGPAPAEIVATPGSGPSPATGTPPAATPTSTPEETAAPEAIIAPTSAPLPAPVSTVMPSPAATPEATATIPPVADPVETPIPAASPVPDLDIAPPPEATATVPPAPTPVTPAPTPTPPPRKEKPRTDRRARPPRAPHPVITATPERTVDPPPQHLAQPAATATASPAPGTAVAPSPVPESPPPAPPVVLSPGAPPASEPLPADLSREAAGGSPAPGAIEPDPDAGATSAPAPPPSIPEAGEGASEGSATTPDATLSATPEPVSVADAPPGPEVIAVEVLTAEQEVRPGEPSEYRFQLTNRASVPVTVRPVLVNSLPEWHGEIVARAEDAWRGDALTIGPEERAIVVVAVTTPGNARVGDRNTISLDLAPADGPVAPLAPPRLGPIREPDPGGAAAA